MAQQAFDLNDTTTAPVNRLARAALQALRVAAELLDEAGHTLGAESGTEELHDAVTAVLARAAQLDVARDGAGDIVFTACDVVHLCEALGGRHRRSSPTALGAAQLAGAAAHLALEAITEDHGWNSTEALSRRARQLVGIHELQDHLDEMVETVERHGLGGTPAARVLRGEVRIAIACADPQPQSRDAPTRPGDDRQS